MITNVLHLSTVGAGFIPALAAADENSSNYTAAGRVGINPTPTAAEFCKRLSIRDLQMILGVVRFVPTYKCNVAAKINE